jgi:hypothetical protein
MRPDKYGKYQKHPVSFLKDFEGQFIKFCLIKREVNNIDAFVIFKINKDFIVGFLLSKYNFFEN